MADKKFAVLELKPINVEVTLRDGTSMELTCKQVTRDMLNAIMKMGDKIRAENMYDQLVIFFGGKREDYLKIDDIRIVKQVLAYVMEQVQDPT